MKGDPQDSLKLANQAIRADAKDPWPYYDKGMALARVGETNGALAALLAAEQHFSPAIVGAMRWPSSGAPTHWPKRAADEARAALRIMSLVRGDSDAVALASRYGGIAGRPLHLQRSDLKLLPRLRTCYGNRGCGSSGAESCTSAEEIGNEPMRQALAWGRCARW